METIKEETVATRQGKKYPVATVRTWRTLTLGFGLVNVKLSIQTLIGDDDDRMGGHVYCKEHRQRVNMKAHCPTCGECETEKCYEHEGRLVTLTDNEAAQLVPLDLEKRLDVQAYVPADSIDPLYIENTYGVWWGEDVYAPAWAMFSEALRESGKWIVGTTQLGRTTRVMALRWSTAAGCVVAHTLKHDARIRWTHMESISEAVRGIEVTPEHVAQAELALSTSLAETFDVAEVEDTYNETLKEAIRAKAEGLAPAPKAPEVGVEIPDLMAALVATIGEGKKKKEAAAKKKAAPKKEKVAA